LWETRNVSKYNLEIFTGGRRVVELENGATKGATVGKDLYYNGVVVRWEDIYNGSAAAQPPSVVISAWSLILDIPPNVTALANQTGTGIYVLTGPGSSATRSIVSTDNSVTITDPDGVSGDIDLSVGSVGGGILPLVTGEVYLDQPRFVYNPDGTLIYARIE
jgi:hypothetical protein